MSSAPDAIVIGSGPNGLVAAITLARKGWSVLVLEQASRPGGAVFSQELTQPGFIHDPASAFYGLLHASPIFKEFSLDKEIEWAHFDTPVGAAVSPSDAAVIHRDLSETVRGLDQDGDAYADLVQWWRTTGQRFFDMMLQPIGAPRPALKLLRKTRIKGSLDLATMMATPISDLVRQRFQTEAARALIASGITHTDLSVEDSFGTPLALILAMLGQSKGMPIPVGGAGRITDALVRLLEQAGGSVQCNAPVSRIVIEKGRATGVNLPDGTFIKAKRSVLANTGAVAMARDLVGEEHLPARYLAGIRRFRYGGGMFKLDIALNRPLKWVSSELDSCGVVHVTGTMQNLAQTAATVGQGNLPSQPALIIGQQCIADPSRAPSGSATLWVETHSPPRPNDAPGWTSVKQAFQDRILDRIESHAPGFRDSIVGLSVRTPLELQAQNPNLVDGDVGGGSSRPEMQAIFRPVPGWFRYATPIKNLYLCSASTHPGGGVHGMCGRNAARRVLRDHRIPWR